MSCKNTKFYICFVPSTMFLECYINMNITYNIYYVNIHLLFSNNHTLVRHMTGRKGVFLKSSANKISVTECKLLLSNTYTYIVCGCVHIYVCVYGVYIYICYIYVYVSICIIYFYKCIENNHWLNIIWKHIPYIYLVTFFLLLFQISHFV